VAGFGIARLQASLLQACRAQMTIERRMNKAREAKFFIGQVVRHRIYPFRGVIFDVDPEFANTEEWWQSIPEDVRPSKDQPFYHLFAENEETEYVAYVSEQNLVIDDSGRPVRNTQIEELFDRDDDGGYRLKPGTRH
jgi:heat shock protein HspQ